VPSPSRVPWLPWSDEAFARAAERDCPVVLDLGAAWSHGCRVLDATTYADPEVVELLSRDYVPVRVDRDRRPDVDERFNLGGWPTTAFLTPGGSLLGGTTYADAGQMKQLLVQLKIGWTEHRSKIDEEIRRRDEKIAEALKKPLPRLPAVTREIFRKTVRGIAATFDSLHGGFGQAPKFPLPASLRVVLQAFQETEGPDFRAVVVKTLDAMGDRGLYDAERGGFFHYVTTNVWTAPRFEKLCEDNAQVIRVFLDAGVAAGVDKYLVRARHALGWVRATLLDPAHGVFFGSQAADDDYYAADPRARTSMTPPPVDRTVFTTSSCAMASTFLRASEVLGEADLADSALRGLDWMLETMVRDGRVAHYHDGQPQLWDLARDPIALATSCLDAYDHTGEARWLEAAGRLASSLPERFWSEVEAGLVDRAVDAPGIGDLAQARRTLSENGLAAGVFVRLWRRAGREEDRAWADRLLRAFPDFLDGYGHETAEYAEAADELVREPQEAPRTPAGLRPFLPRRIVR
jgi:uncharacterized protein